MATTLLSVSPPTDSAGNLACTRLPRPDLLGRSSEKDVRTETYPACEAGDEGAEGECVPEEVGGEGSEERGCGDGFTGFGCGRRGGGEGWCRGEGDDGEERV